MSSVWPRKVLESHPYFFMLSCSQRAIGMGWNILIIIKHCVVLFEKFIERFRAIVVFMKFSKTVVKQLLAYHIKIIFLFILLINKKNNKHFVIYNQMNCSMTFYVKCFNLFVERNKNYLKHYCLITPNN